MLAFKDGRKLRVSVRNLSDHLNPIDLRKVKSAIKLRREFLSTHMPKFLILLAVGGLLGVGALAVTPRSFASHPAQSKTFPKVQSVKTLPPAQSPANPSVQQSQPINHGVQSVPKPVQPSAASAPPSQGPAIQHVDKLTEPLKGLTNTVKSVTNLPDKVVQGLGLKL